MSIRVLASLAFVIIAGAAVRVDAWGVQGHRVVALLAIARLSPVARANVALLLPDRTLADVSRWADDYITDNTQTGPWHYVNLPEGATRYERDRDCPRQPGVAAGSPADRWRDCIVDRILYSQQRLGDAALDRADRAIALKFLVHFVADLHQPFHATGIARGGNTIPLVVFGSPTCVSSSGATNPCNLHGGDAARVDVTRGKSRKKAHRGSGILSNSFSAEASRTPASASRSSITSMCRVKYASSTVPCGGSRARPTNATDSFAHSAGVTVGRASNRLAVIRRDSSST